MLSSDRHPDAACERSEQAGKGRDPVTPQLAVGMDERRDAGALAELARESRLEVNWVPAYAGMTWRRRRAACPSKTSIAVRSGRLGGTTSPKRLANQRRQNPLGRQTAMLRQAASSLLPPGPGT
jgi:hypothetical protein